MKLVRLFGVLLVLLYFSPSAWCADLRAVDVKGFIGSMQELKPYFDQYADETGDDGDASSTSQVVSDWAKSMKDQHEVETVLKKHGFDFERWTVISQQVTQAYMAVKFGEDGQNVQAQMEESIASIETMPDIPADQKTQMIQQMRQSMEEMDKILKSAPEDQEAVKPFVSQLDTIFDWQE